MNQVVAAIVAIVVGAFGLWLSSYYKRKDEKEKYDLEVHSNPPDPRGIADIDRLQNNRDVSSRK